MTTTSRPEQATHTIDSQILSVCRDYHEAHGYDMETSDYLRLTARVWEILDRMSAPGMEPVENILYSLERCADLDRGDWLPGRWPVSHPEHGPAVSTIKDSLDADIRAALGALTWQATR